MVSSNWRLVSGAGLENLGEKSVAWIRTIQEGEAAGKLRDLYDASRDPATGKVDNILAIHGLHPEGLSAHLALYQAVMRGTASLSKLERELLAFVVSLENGCHY